MQYIDDAGDANGNATVFAQSGPLLNEGTTNKVHCATGATIKDQI
jgi:hypothetical protein